MLYQYLFKKLKLYLGMFTDYPMANFRPLAKRQPHSSDIN